MGTLDYFDRKPYKIGGGGAGDTNVYLEAPLQTILIDSEPEIQIVVILIE